jgi:hypothetical protein
MPYFPRRKQFVKTSIQFYPLHTAELALRGLTSLMYYIKKKNDELEFEIGP